MKCCTNCFGDIGLHDILPSLSDSIGKCDYCGTEKVALTEPKKLYDIFSTVTNIYEISSDGQDLVSWFREDWGMFEHSKMDDFRVKDLLSTILDNPSVVRQKFKPSSRFKSDHLERWEKLTDELRKRNRFFPEVEIDFSRLEELLKFLKAQNLEKQWYRARINSDDTAFSIDKMGAPPVGAASHGRANPPGIPYLYVGSTPKTSISEIRPHTGETATIAEFEIDTSSLAIVDLRAPKKLISPFSLGDEDKIGALRGDIDFLQKLGNELTRPVRPHTAPVEYVPSQYLCEFIKRSNWNGVLYSSSVSDGVNLALFDPEKATPKGTSLWDIDTVIVDASQRQ